MARITASRGETILVEGIFSFEVQRVLGDQVFYGRGIRFMLCGQDTRIKITGEQI